MKYDFETVINRRKTGSSKWAVLDDNVPDNIVPLSVADVDLVMAPELQEGLIDFMRNNPVLGYTSPTDAYYDAVINWFKDYYDFNIDKEAIVLSSGVVPALGDAIKACSKAGEGVIVFSPVYYPFYSSIELNDRKIIKCPLIDKDSKYSINFDLLESFAKDDNNRLLILCNPHNPIGRVWRKEELLKIGKICLENNIIIVSDEIHCDLTMPGFVHYPIASLSDELKDITIMCSAPSKSFNIAGLQGSNIIIFNEELRKKFTQEQLKKAFFGLNTISYQATILAYNKARAWLENFKVLINSNYELLVNFFKENYPDVVVYPLEATYLVWVDFRKLGYNYQELEEIMKKAYLYLDEGYVFGEEGKGFERFNIATSSKVLLEALNRLKGVL